MEAALYAGREETNRQLLLVGVCQLEKRLRFPRPKSDLDEGTMLEVVSIVVLSRSSSLTSITQRTPLLYYLVWSRLRSGSPPSLTS